MLGDSEHTAFSEWAQSRGVRVYDVAPASFPGRGLGIVSRNPIEVRRCPCCRLQQSTPSLMAGTGRCRPHVCTSSRRRHRSIRPSGCVSCDWRYHRARPPGGQLGLGCSGRQLPMASVASNVAVQARFPAEPSIALGSEATKSPATRCQRFCIPARNGLVFHLLKAWLIGRVARYSEGARAEARSRLRGRVNPLPRCGQAGLHIPLAHRQYSLFLLRSSRDQGQA